VTCAASEGNVVAYSITRSTQLNAMPNSAICPIKLWMLSLHWPAKDSANAAPLAETKLLRPSAANMATEKTKKQLEQPHPKQKRSIFFDEP